MKRSIKFRALNEDDCILMHKWRQDEEIQRLVGRYYKFISLEMERTWIKKVMMDNTENIYLAICLNDESEQMIGYTSLNNINYHDRTAITGGLVFGEKDYRDGIMLIDYYLMIYDYAFNQLNMNRLYGYCLESHKTTIRMAVMMGHEIEGISRQGIFKNGEYQNLVNLSILKEDYSRILNSGGFTLKEITKRLSNIKKEGIKVKSFEI
jgi:RimJ/RimL family protein N-acetyltransferase